MVSRFYRHLSLLLVVSLATSWLVVPLNLQTKALITANAAETASTCPNPNTYNANDSTHNGWVNYFYSSSIPDYQHICFTKAANGDIYDVYTDKNTPNSTFFLRFTKLPGPPVPGQAGTYGDIFAGCDTNVYNGNGCTKNTANRYNLFTFYDAVDFGTKNFSFGDEGGSVPVSASRQTYSDVKVSYYGLVDNNGKVVRYTGASTDPNAYLISDGSKYVYGFHSINAPRVEFYQANAETMKVAQNRVKDHVKNWGTNDFDFIKANTARLSDPLNNYIKRVNDGINPYAYVFAGQTAIDSTTTASEKSATVRAAVVRLFKDVKITDSSNPVHLIDNPSGPKEAPTSPPIVTVTISSAQKASFILTAVRTSSAGSSKNNYFVFKMMKEGANTSSNVQTEIGDIDNVYLVIDVAGNIGFMVDDPTTDGGIFGASGVNNLDKYIVLGAFDADDPTRSAQGRDSTPAGPGHIDFTEYSQIITSRVYNEPADPGTSDVCKGNDNIADLILFPETNSEYADTDIFPRGIPDSKHRQCINNTQKAGDGTGTTEDNHPGGWLATWKISFDKIDKAKVSDDECVQALSTGNSGVGKLIALPLCAMINWTISGAVFFAGLAVEFMIQALGLQ